MVERRCRSLAGPERPRSVAAPGPTAVLHPVMVGLLVVALVGAAGAGAKTFTVDVVNADTGDITKGDGICALISFGGCTLRGAVQEANAWPGPDVILVPVATTINLTLSGSDDTAVFGDLDILEDVEIRGLGAGVTVISAQNSERIFDILPGAHVTIFGLTLRDGVGTGGAIQVRSGATLVLRDSELTANLSYDASGAVESLGTTTILGSYIHGNRAADTTGVYYGEASAVRSVGPSGSMRIESSTITDNSCGSCSMGKPAAVVATTYLEVVNTTISDNTTGIYSVPADGIDSSNDLFVQSSTITGNTGRGIVYSVGALLLVNSIVADNDLGDCALASGDFITRSSLDSDGSCSLSVGTGSLPSTNPLLGPLGDFGGPTPTRMPFPGSPVIDAGSDLGSDCPLADQRGAWRPQDGDVSGGAACDMGAVEVGPVALFEDGFESGNTGEWSAVAP